ncbi:GSU3473 family protein [Trichloromonas sp.]|uniref:GSU3473 family protein n=1 Tax=Trichloromonas sp. TaxID=3069249 RepID=UPI003D81BFBF
MIRVLYHDGRYDMVKRWTLEMLIEQNRIQGFRRANGWVRIGKDKLRAPMSSKSREDERRVPVDYPSTSKPH